MSLNHALSARSDFSIGESMLQVGHLVEKAVELGYESVALVDTMSLHALVEFTNAAKKKGIKPIIGCRLRVYDDPTYRKPSKASGEKEKPNSFYMLKAWVTEEAGIKSLLKLLSRANSEECFYYHSRCGLDDVMKLEGVVIGTGDLFSVFHHDRHEEIVLRLAGKFQVMAELVPIDTPLFDTLNAKVIALLNKGHENVAPLVTYPTFYADDGDAATLEVLNCITTNTQMDVAYRSKQFVKDFFFQEPSHLIERVKGAAKRLALYDRIAPVCDWTEGLRNIQMLADACAYEFKKQSVCLPKMAENEFMTLGKKCLEGWKRRFTNPVLGYLPPASAMPEYQARLQYELSVLKNMGFSGYFLLVENLVTWAKNNGVSVGPGRGSVGGSLVAYLLGITDVDPIRFGLLFERFINPERLDLPDADLDFMSSKRHLVVEYLTEKYGSSHVAGISNYSTLASASALRDAGRMYGLSGLDLACTKLVPKEHGQSCTLTEAAKVVPEIEKFKGEHADIWNHAIKLEGAMRSFGQHAAGVIVAGEPLIERAVVETRAGSPVVNWDKRSVEDWGLIKMDLLGLSTLDALEIAKQYVRERHGAEIDYLKLPLEEQAVMEAFGRGDTTGVFQFESGGMKNLLRNLAKGGPLSFEDIAAATALYRPGPMDSGLMDDFVAIKQGYKTVHYDHPNLENALRDTYGVVVYQEQVMQAAVDLAGFTRAEADGLRKAMGKKDKDKMAEMRQKWVDGCKTTSAMSEGRAGALFDKIEMFAGYGFNKSHAVEYSIISVWTMWVRVHYPAEYFAACMSIVKEDKLPGLVADARECGIEVLPPDINLSCERFTIPDDKHILAPFSAVKGISENTALRIVELRERNRDWKVVRVKRKRDGTTGDVFGMDEAATVKGRFDSFEEFATAAAQPGSKVNSAAVANMDKVGAFAGVMPGSLSARHPDRRKDQTELMPGLIIDAVKADRQTDVSEKFLRAKIITMAQEYKKCEDCDLAGKAHPTVRCKATVKFMVVTDCPTWEEEKKDQLLTGEAADFIKVAIKDAGLNVVDGYYTTLVKAKKTDKFLTNAQLNGCKKFIGRELELIKPSVIVALGSATIKHFIPGAKPQELVGKAIYDPKLDATIICGINAAQCIFDPAKADILTEVFNSVAEILS
ncbi:MAG: DNA polymerase III subunit alpha [Betaproteobacteria bacterium]|nr:DNA polymerase III subunit alpha [Betaproteobacteria bacterium]